VAAKRGENEKRLILILSVSAWAHRNRNRPVGRIYEQASQILRKSALWPNIVPGGICDQSGFLPKALPDAEWTEDAAFSAGEAIFANPLLKEVYKEAILKGCAFEKVKI
jgi:hypothetical protein